MKPTAAFGHAFVLGLALIGLARPLRAEILVAGAAADQTTFLNIVNAASTGGTWTAPLGHLTFTAGAGAMNNFTTALRGFNNAAGTNDVTLNVGNSQPGVAIGAFMGGGNQTLDLTDIQAFPAAPGGLDARSAVLIHEVAEVWDSVANAHGFDAAHLVGIATQNGELAALGGTGTRGAPPDRARLRGGVTEIVVPWTDTANAAVVAMIVRLNAAVNITAIRAGGLFDLDAPYDGSDLDIGVETIYAETVPEPSTIVIAAMGLLGFARLARARRR